MVVVARQMQYTLSKNLGLDRERVLYIPMEGELAPRLETFRQQVIGTSSIASATTVNQLPVNIHSSSGDLSWPGKVSASETNLSATKVGYVFLETIGFDLTVGRDFSRNYSSDSSVS